MKKTNKIMMAAVSILLSLVLISTSLVSGIFARFVIKKDASTAITFTRFGVDVALDFSDDIKALCTDKNEDGILDQLVATVDKGVLTFTLPDLKLAPGIDFTDAIRLNVTGNPGVDCKLRVDFSLKYSKKIVSNTETAFLIPMSIIDETLTANRRLVPFGYTFGYKMSNATAYTDNITVKAWNINEWRGNDKSSTTAIANIVDLTSVNEDSTGNCNYWLEKTLSANQDVALHLKNDPNVNINDIAFGFYWPFEHSENDYHIDNETLTTEDFNKIDEYIVKNQPTVTLQFIVTVEQT